MAAIVLPVLIFAGCGGPKPAPPATQKPYQVMGRWYYPLAHARGYEEEGVASWYGRDFHGRKTSNGEIYDMHGLSAAHKTLPMGTYVRVFNLENGRTMDLRINDRGPFVKNRIIDLSYAAAARMGFSDAGTAKVRITALGAASRTQRGKTLYTPLDYYTGNFTYQVGAFRNRENAERLLRVLGPKYKNAHITEYDRGDALFYRVRVGKFTNLDEARAQLARLVADGHEEPFIVAE